MARITAQKIVYVGSEPNVMLNWTLNTKGNFQIALNLFISIRQKYV